MKKIRIYSFKEKNIQIWTPEGFKDIDEVIHIESANEIESYLIEAEDKHVILPYFFNVKTARGYIGISDLKEEDDAVVVHTKNNLNTLKTLTNIEKVTETIKEAVVIKIKDSYITRIIPNEEEENNFVCLDLKGNKTVRRLDFIKDGDYIQVSDEFKKIICKRKANRKESIIVINMNNNCYFINDFAVVLDEDKIKKEGVTL